MKLSMLSVLLGCGLALPQVYGLMKPKEFAAAAQKFPRSTVCGYVLMLLATLWFLAYVKQEDISDFAAYKPVMLGGFGFMGVMTCLYVSDFLAVRGLALVMMLLGKLMVDTARWTETDWRLVIVIWAYVLVFFGMWLTISPWRLRDFLNWATANEKRVKVGSAIRLAFALFVMALGLTVF